MSRYETISIFRMQKRSVKYVHDFSHVALPGKVQELTTQLIDNFQTLKPASSS
ncbi:hypothetical protein [Xenorhabdus bovienii]|uniref:hypothetical protein n=1 Tax=Xenorhabdus bovienii TaxID=40576 RepID=UPI003F6C5DCB